MSVRRTILLALAAALWTSFAGAMEADERLQFADGLYARGLYALAIQEYNALLASNAVQQTADQVYFRRGECHRHLGDRVNADSDYRRVASEFPQSDYRHRAAYRRAQLFLDGGQVDEAIGLFRAALDGKPPADVASACLYFLGEAQERKALSDEARGTWERMLAEYPDGEFAPYAQLKLGALYGGGLKQPDRALEFYARAAAKPGTDRVAAEALFQMGEIQFEQKKYEPAAESFGKLIRAYPGDARAAEAPLKAAWAAHYAGRYADALRYAAPTNAAAGATNTAVAAEWLYLQANCERQLARHEAAIATYGRLIEAYPQSEYVSGARYELALVLYRAGRFEEAVAAARQVPETDRLVRDVYWVMAESYAAMDRQDDAIQYYRLITRKFPDSPLAADASYRLGHLLQAKGEFLEAARAFTKAATDAPNSDVAPQALFASAFCFDKAGQHGDAARDWGALVDRYPQHGLAEEALYQKGVSETRLERSADATETFRRLAERYPQGRFAADAHYWRGMLLREAGRREDALSELQLARKASPRPELQREVEFGLALLLQDLGRAGEAADLLTPLVRTPVRGKFTPALSRWLAERQLERGQYTNVLETAELLQQQTGGDTQLCAQAGWVLKGRAAMAMDRKDAAAEAFRKALAIDVKSPDAAEAALHLGELALAAGNTAEAQSCFERSAAMANTDRLLPVRAKAYAGLGRTANATRNPSAAARYFMSVAVLFDDDQLVPESLWLASEAFRAAGQPDAAAKALGELRERYPDSSYAKAPPPSVGSVTNAPP
jgi:TolA-binding protein